MERLHPDKTFTLKPEDGEAITLPLDPVDFAEVLSILLDNAGKWARREVTLTLACLPNGASKVTIADDGPGIPVGLIDRAFEVGARFDPAVAGSGLGLAIARDLCDAMGVELILENESDGLVATLRSPAENGDQI